MGFFSFSFDEFGMGIYNNQQIIYAYCLKGAIFVAKVTFLKDVCKGCSLCIEACPKQIIALSESINAKGYNYAQITDEGACIGCASCARMCPDCVITVEK